MTNPCAELLEEIMGCNIHWYVEVRKYPDDRNLVVHLRAMARGDPADRTGPAVLADFMDENGLSLAGASPDSVRRMTAGGLLRYAAPWEYRPDACQVRDKHFAVLGQPWTQEQQNASWEAYFTDPLYVGRNYVLFTALAGVRDYSRNIPPVAKPRGVPADASPEVMEEFTLRIVPDDRYDADTRGVCSQSSAGRWVRYGSSEWVIKDKVVTHPEWHTPSWLTVAEMMAYNWSRQTGVGGELTTLRKHCRQFVDGTLPCLAKLADDPADVRAVFWFDN